MGFDYVLLREFQSDRIEGEFGIYRQSTGGNMFSSGFRFNMLFLIIINILVFFAKV